MLKTAEEDIGYAAVAQDIINKVIDTETSVPQNPQNVTVKYNASLVPGISDWRSLGEHNLIHKKFGLGDQEVKISYPGDDRYPDSDVTAKVVVEEAGEETQMTLTEGCSVTYAPEEELRQEIYHAVLPQVQTADGTAVSTTIDDFDISFEHTTGDVEVSFRYKGKANEYKDCEGTVLVNIKKARVRVSVESQNIVYGEIFKDPIVTTSPEDVDCLTIIGGMDGDAEGFISIKLPQSIKEIGSIGNINIYDAIVKIFGNGIDLNALPEAIDKINELLDLISKVPGAPELGIDFSEIQKILDYLPDNVNAKVYLEKNPSEAGMYVVGAVTTDKNYWTGVGVGFLTVAPKTADVKLAFNQEMPENNRIPLAEVDNFAFGGKLVDIENQELEANIRTFYSGTSIDGEFHTNTKPIKEEGIYTETIYLLGGNYVALPIVRTYIIGKEPTVVKFDQNSILKTYDGNPAGLTAGVFDSKGNRISEAELTYTGVDLGGVEYQSTEAPINAGVYQVTASYGGDDVHQAAIPNIIGLVTIAQARPATIKINDITTDEGVTPDPQAYSYEREGFVGENDNTRTDLLTEIKCKEGADITKDHEIVGVVNRDVAKNYMRVKVESGTHHVIPKTRVHVTLISNAASGTFPDGADVLNYDFTEDEPMLQLPEVTAKDGWKFTGWTVAGQEQKTIDPDTESINVMEYANFDNDSKNGTLTIFAAYEKEEEKTVNVYFSINKEKGEFTENPEAENLSYENLTEDQLALPKVTAKAGYVFTGWRGQGAEEIE